jgi:cysteine desulfurase
VKNKIYLDNNATTGVDPRVLEAMLSELSSIPSNPSSSHFFGQEAKRRLQTARETIACFFKVKSHEVVFTSGGTEAVNLVLRGFFPDEVSGHAITSNVEHSCVDHTMDELRKKGLDVSFLPAGLHGAVLPEQIEKAIRPDTRFIALMAVNNETGVKHDLNAIGQIALQAKIPLIVDGVAWLGKESFTLHPGVAAICFSGHKFHAPKGVGFAIVRSSMKIHPLVTGGQQEFSLRPGTENLPGIIGLAKAIELLDVELPAATLRMAMLRDRLEAGLIERAAPVVVNGGGNRICNTCNLSFPDVSGEDLLIGLDMAGIAVSHGSACSAGALEPSRILLNMGVPHNIARSAVRFSLSRNTTLEEIDRTIDATAALVHQLRGK